jgi:hypothetical protein
LTVNELISVARSDFLHDIKEPYKWSDVYLAQLFSQAEREACRRACIILDKTTQTSGNVATGTATSTTANKIVDTGATFTSAVVGLTVYNTTDNTWTTVTALDSATALSLASDIMASGESYVIGDASKALTRVCVTAGVSDYALSDKIIKIYKCYLSSRGKSYPLIQKVDINSDVTGTPCWYMEDKKLISLYPAPDTSINSGMGIDTLNLEVYRLPLVDLDIATNSTPEIDEEYHFSLIHYVCSKAFIKQDDRAIDPAKSQWHDIEFTKVFGPPVSEHFATMLRQMPSDFKLSRGEFGL